MYTYSYNSRIVYVCTTFNGLLKTRRTILKICWGVNFTVFHKDSIHQLQQYGEQQHAGKKKHRKNLITLTHVNVSRTSIYIIYVSKYKRTTHHLTIMTKTWFFCLLRQEEKIGTENCEERKEPFFTAYWYMFPVR